MKTFKMLQTGLAITVLSVLIGCSDQLINPELSSTNNSSASFGESIKVKPHIGTLESQLVLKPNDSFTFDIMNTGFTKINSIDAEIITVRVPVYRECSNLHIYSKSSTLDMKINCFSTGLDLNDITIENTGEETITLSVKLTGVIKFEKPDSK